MSLLPSEAVLIDSFYNGGFLVGRIISIFVAFVLRPRNMIFMCMVGCLMAAALLVAMAHRDIVALYGGVCKCMAIHSFIAVIHSSYFDELMTLS